MRMPAEVMDTVRLFINKMGPPPHGDDRDYTFECQLWTHALSQQLRYSHGERWGHKSAGTGRPHSSDVVAYKGPEGFFGYDLWVSVGSSSQRFNDNPDPIDLAPDNQIFEPVEPKNWIDDPTTGGGNGGGGGIDITVDEFAEKIAQVLIGAAKPYVAALVMGAKNAEVKLNDLEAKLNAGFDIEFKVFGKTIKGKVKPSA